MPYSKEHKLKTRQKILQSAFQLFTEFGFSSITINQIMEHCQLTRGAFYAHFTSKNQLYADALKHAALKSALAQPKPAITSNKEWLITLLNNYLSYQHVKGFIPCPLAFLATDIVNTDSKIKQAYQGSFTSMNSIIYDYAKSHSQSSKEQILALTSMIIGAVAIARTMEDRESIENLLNACKLQAMDILGFQQHSGSA